MIADVMSETVGSEQDLLVLMANVGGIYDVLPRPPPFNNQMHSIRETGMKV